MMLFLSLSRILDSMFYTPGFFFLLILFPMVVFGVFLETIFLITTPIYKDQSVDSPAGKFINKENK
jgi:hypothetical protein